MKLKVCWRLPRLPQPKKEGTQEPARSCDGAGRCLPTWSYRPVTSGLWPKFQSVNPPVHPLVCMPASSNMPAFIKEFAGLSPASSGLFARPGARACLRVMTTLSQRRETPSLSFSGKTTISWCYILLHHMSYQLPLLQDHSLPHPRLLLPRRGQLLPSVDQARNPG